MNTHQWMTSRVPPPDNGKNDLERWLIELLIILSIEWLLGEVKIPANAPVYALARSHVIALGILGAVALHLLLIPIRRRFPAIDRRLRWLFAARWRVFLVTPLAAITVSLELSAPLIVWVTAHTHPQYEASTPGPGCDTRSQRWIVRTSVTQVRCNGRSLDLALAAGTTTLGEVAVDLVGLLTSDDVGAAYCVQASATIVAGDAKMAVNLGIRGQNPGGQLIEVTASGAVTILRYTREGAPDSGPPLFEGSVSAAPTYRLTGKVNGAHTTVWINGPLVASVVDAIYFSTLYVLLALRANDGQPAEALFSNFRFDAGTLVGCGSA